MQDIKLLQASADAETESDLRILVNGNRIKYLIVDPGVYDIDDICFEPQLVSILPTLTDGTWVSGRISRSSITSQAIFTPLSDNLPSVSHVWHPQIFDYLSLAIGKKLRTGVYEVSHPKLVKTAVVKFARFSWEIPQLDNETRAYSWLTGQDFCPKFLGHVAEHGRVIGFLLEHITDARHATSDDLHGCERALSRLHEMNILHGDTNKHNFLITDTRVVIIDFDSATRCDSKDTLSAETHSLEKQLADTSGRGGSLPPWLSGYPNQTGT